MKILRHAIIIRRVLGGFLVRTRQGVPPVFIGLHSELTPRDAVAAYLEQPKVWECTFA